MSVQNAFIKTTVGVSIVYISYILMIALLFSFAFFFDHNIFSIKKDSLTYDPAPFLLIGTLPMLIALVIVPTIFEVKIGNTQLRTIGFRLIGENRLVEVGTYVISIAILTFVIFSNFTMAMPVLIHFSVSCFGEELLFRGILQRRMTESMNAILAIVLCSLIFAIGFHQDTSLIDNLLIRFPLGLIFGIIYYKTKNLLPCFMIHLAYNMLVSF
ncbi:CPBP family intramembrane glutamic endopeptidase [Niallia sp. XMNu-256]|uniref:CPBP family intramembrane glutamic endopeptidase n=1 Tax=Niallia sp. XMNu-256 TaxID=3082444 RepID=UPI0030D57455